MADPVAEIPMPDATLVADPLAQADAWLSIADLEKLTRLHRRTIYRMIKRSEFPASFSLGANTSRWRLADYQAWAQARTRH